MLRVIAWFCEQMKLRELRAEFLRERNDIVFCNAWGELEGDYNEEMEKLKKKYVGLGLSREDIERTDRKHPWVRVE